ncbi:hypothetical protein L1049_000806 [Liquidambar formosana]|uniref:non-specific serine/threonine protein kinase n=1 Tax=Liquidambar formosana TaxID=63359 RepID=A0AAP0R5M5_LIQFO
MLKKLEAILGMASNKSHTTSIVVVILSSLCLRGPYSTSHAQTDTIKPGQVLRYSSGQTLTSAGGIFELGFIQLYFSNYGYLGLWYKDYPRTIVWVANRNTPIAGRDANLTLDTDGRLKIIHSGGTAIILNSDQAAVAQNSTATLTDSGNFVVTDLSTERVLWQSFDYPTDTLLPGMKLGTNFQTGQNWVLTSWVSESVTAPGAFSLEWKFNNSNGTGQLVMRRRGDAYWTSGILNTRNRTFQNIPWLSNTSSNDYRFSYISNENESYFNYSVASGRISMWLLYSGGQLLDVDKPDLVPSDICYGYASYPGCAVEEAPECRSSLQKFEPRSGRFLALPVEDKNLSAGPSDCWARCWNQCSCFGFDSLNADYTGCKFWSSEFLPDYSGVSSKINVLNSTSSDNDNRSNNGKKWWIWIIVGVAVLATLLLGLFFCLRRKLNGEEERNEDDVLFELTTSDRFNDSNDTGNNRENGHQVKVFSFASIMAATDNFSLENKLGQGGFGPVYKVNSKTDF